jgi:hypothetical protein
MRPIFGVYIWRLAPQGVRDQHMLSEEDVSSCIEGLIRLGVLETVPEDRDRGELIRFNIPAEGVVGRIFGGEFGEPPEGAEMFAWFSCIMLKIVLEGKAVSVSKKEFTAMAAIITGFMSQAAVGRISHSRQPRPMMNPQAAKARKKIGTPHA